jgi:hypothetical protein
MSSREAIEYYPKSFFCPQRFSNRRFADIGIPNLEIGNEGKLLAHPRPHASCMKARSQGLRTSRGNELFCIPNIKTTAML